MKKFIKVFTLLSLVFGLGFLLAACGGKELKSISGDATVSVAVDATKTVNLTVNPTDHDDELVVTVADTTKVKATLTGLKLELKGLAEGTSKVTVSGKKATAVKHEINVTVTAGAVVQPTTHDVVFKTTAPEGTLQVFVIGEINDWNLETAHEMTKGADNVWSVTVNLAEGDYEYKYINARDWAYVEKDAEGAEIDNRTLTVNAQGATVNDTVATWAKLWQPEVKTLRGITDTEILVGNTAALAGAFGFVGEPFQAGIEVVFRAVNANGGVHGRQIRIVNRDDGGDPQTGVQNTKELVETDKVFAIVGHFAGTVGATLQYLKDNNVPMFYAANGTNLMYEEANVGSPIFPVQPISKTDGRMMMARALTDPVHGPDKNEQLKVATAKIGVLKAVTAGSEEMHEGILREAEIAGLPTANLIVKEFDATDNASMTAAANALKTAGVDAILLPLSQAEFKAIMPALIASGNTAPAYSSYFVADPSAVPESFEGQFPLYSNAWLDITSPKGGQELLDFVAAIQNDTVLTADEKTAYTGNAYAIAGYVAATMFVASVERMGNIATADFSVERYIASNESSAFNVPMGGSISFENGSRIGITDLALLAFVIDPDTGVRAYAKAHEIENLTSLQNKYK